MNKFKKWKGRYSRFTELHNDAQTVMRTVFSGQLFLDNSYGSLANYSAPAFLCDPCVFSRVVSPTALGHSKTDKNS